MSGFRITVPPVIERVTLAATVGMVAVAAWVVLWSAGPGFHGVLHLHDRADLATSLRLSNLPLFIAAWTAMSVAMMLPTCLPVLAILHTFARERADRLLLLALATLGYLAAWTAAGALAGPLSLGLQEAVASPAEPGFLPRVLAPALLLVAGLFQFSALKYRCLDLCRSPLQVVLSHWQGRRERWQALRLGWASGVFCVGCCWALMLLMLLSSVGHLAWMLGLTLVMAVEKNVRGGRRLSAPLGVVLILGAGVALAAGGERGLFWSLGQEICGVR